METDLSKNTVLFVDDEENILKSLKRGLMREKYKKLFASSGQEALKIMKRNEVNVIVTDMRMPGMSGLELLHQVKREYPDTVKIVLSGYTQLPQVLATINQVDIYKFITKPWDLENEFKKVINDALNYYNVKFENEMLRKSVSKKNELYQKLLKSNDEKLRSIKRDFDEVFNIQRDSFSMISNMSRRLVNGELTIVEYNTVVKQIASIFADMAQYFPSEFTNMDFFEFSSEINQIVFASQHPDIKYDPNMHARHVSFIGIKGTAGEYRANFKLLLFVFKKLFLNILKCQSGNIYNVVVKQSDIYLVSKTPMCKLTFLIDETRPMHEINELVRYVNVTLLDHLMRSLGGGLQVTYKGDKVLLILEIELEPLNIPDIETSSEDVVDKSQ